MRVKLSVWLLVAACVVGACRTGPTPVDQVDGNGVDLAHFFAHEPAVVFRVESEAVADFEGLADDVGPLVFGSSGEASQAWAPEALVETAGDLVDHGLASEAIENEGSLWLAVTTATEADFVENLALGMPFSAGKWSRSIHLRLMLPRDDGGGDAFGDWEVERGELDVLVRSEELDEHLLVDALFVDAELGEAARSRLWERLDDQTHSQATAEATPAFRRFLESDKAMALYASYEGLADLAAARAALDSRRRMIDAFDGEETERRESVFGTPLESWLVMFERIHRERQLLWHPDARIDDVAVEIEADGGGFAGSVLSTQTKDAPDTSADDELRRLPEPVDEPSLLSIDSGYDVHRVLHLANTPSGHFGGSREAIAEGLRESTLRGAVYLANHRAALENIAGRIPFDRLPKPVAFRVRLFSPDGESVGAMRGQREGGGPPTRLALAARFPADSYTYRYFYRLQDDRRPADVDIEWEEGGYLRVLVALDATVEEVFSEPDEDARIDDGRLEVDIPALKAQMERESLPLLGPLESIVEAFEPLETIGVATRSNAALTSVEFNWRSNEEIASPDLPDAADVEQRSAPSACHEALSMGRAGDYRQFGDRIDAFVHPSEEPLDEELAAVERCRATGEAPEEVYESIEARYFWLAGTWAASTQHVEAAARAFEEACERGLAEACGRGEAHGLLARKGRVPYLGWPTNSEQAFCSVDAYLQVGDGVWLDGEKLPEVSATHGHPARREESAMALAEALEEVDPAEPFGLFEGYSAPASRRSSRLALMVDPGVDAAAVLSLVDLADSLNKEVDVRAVAVAEGLNGQGRCVPLRFGSGDGNDEKRVQLEVSERGFDLRTGGEEVDAELLCPSDGPAICRRDQHMGYPDGYWRKDTTVPESFRVYDLPRLADRLRESPVWANHSASVAVALDEEVSWELFLAALDLLREPGREQLFEKVDPSVHRGVLHHRRAGQGVEAVYPHVEVSIQ